MSTQMPPRELSSTSAQIGRGASAPSARQQTQSTRETCLEPCPIERGMRIIGGKWTGSILWHLKDGPVRFNELSRLIGGASKKMITERLRQLEAQGLITRRVLSTSPVSVEYEITSFGSSAVGFLDALRNWSESLPENLQGD